MYEDRSYCDLTQAEVDKMKKLTPQEQAAVDVFIAAAKALPKSLCISVDSDAPHLCISKRITRGSCLDVATLRKKSLHFGV